MQQTDMAVLFRKKIITAKLTDSTLQIWLDTDEVVYLGPVMAFGITAGLEVTGCDISASDHFTTLMCGGYPAYIRFKGKPVISVSTPYQKDQLAEAAK